MSHRRKHIKNKIYRNRPRKSIYKNYWFWAGLLFLSLFLTGGYFLLFYPGFQVKDVIISGNEKVTVGELQGIVLQNVGGSLTRSIFLVDTSSLNEEILKQFPIIEKLTIRKKYPRSIILGVVERKAVGVFCDSFNENQKCFLIDGNGIIFESLAVDSGGMAVIRREADSREFFTGENVVQRNIMDIIGKMQDSLREKYQIGVKEAFLSSPLRLDITTSENWKIYLNAEDGADPVLQIKKLNILLDEEIGQAGRKNLRYIDLRPEGRAIICDNSVCVR